MRDLASLAALLNHGHRRLNALCFGGRLTLPNWHLADELRGETHQCNGAWWPDGREIRLRRDLLENMPLLIGVILHEMTHQYVEEVGGCPGAGHGPLFIEAATRAGRAVGIAPPLPDHADAWPQIATREEN